MSKTFFLLYCISLFSVDFFKKVNHGYNKSRQTLHANH